MRHRKKFNHLGRKTAHRKAMLSNMASSLILHKRISTTTAKAKALKMYVEPLISKSKVDSTHSRRIVFGYLKQKEAVTELFREVSPKITNRNGGYTRILKTGNRLGDNAEMCIVELVDFNETYLTEKKAVAKKSTRRKRGGSKASGQAATEVSEVKAEAVKTEKAPEAPETETEEIKKEEE
ncbi:50S ribosomal protein L17 [Labilibaculum euxinus]